MIDDELEEPQEEDEPDEDEELDDSFGVEEETEAEGAEVRVPEPSYAHHATTFAPGQLELLHIESTPARECPRCFRKYESSALRSEFESDSNHIVCNICTAERYAEPSPVFQTNNPYLGT